MKTTESKTIQVTGPELTGTLAQLKADGWRWLGIEAICSADYEITLERVVEDRP